MSIGGGSAETPANKRPMSTENEPIIPLQVKYIEAQSATILKNRRVASPAPILTISEPQDQQCQATLLNNDVNESPTCAAEGTDVSRHSPVLSPASGSPNNPMIPNKFQFDPNLSYAEKVAHEMIITEKVYLENLKQIIDGFLGPVSNHPNLDVSQDNIEDLFINVEEIYSFNRVLLEDMEECYYDPVKLAECFVLKQIGFGVYTRYCTHYPRSMEVLLEWNQREDTANFIKTQQEALGHTLPLCSFLLKPVQRILKYHLLLGNIAKHYKQSEDEEGFEVIQKALATMTNVAKHINDMKRKHEDAVHLQEIQSVLIDYEGPNLTSFGGLVLEDTFRLHGTKTGRYLLLFEKALLITKRRSDGTFTWKATVMFLNMMLADSVFREPLTFQVIPYDDRKICHTFVARNMDTKQVWLLELKRRLLDSYAAAVPMKAKQMILGNAREDCEKENAEPEIYQKSSVSHTRKGANQQRTQSTKDSSAQSGKFTKSMENDRRKTREAEENFDEKSLKSSDSLKSPLRRLRVFKKRKFSKDQGKPSKRVSWSSDENNDEPAHVENGPATPMATADQQDQDVEVPPDEDVSETNTVECDSELQQNNTEEKDADKNDVIPMEPSLPDATTMTSAAGEDSDVSGEATLRQPEGESLPVKKRRLAKELRDKCELTPFGEFLIDEEEPTTVREHSSSMPEAYEKFTEELFADPSSNERLQNKYGLVNLRENAHVIRTRRLGSYDEHMTSVEGNLRRNPGMNNLTDEAMSKLSGDTSVTQTLKCVSAAFSDISPNFSPEKTPTSSTEELDLTDPDEESDELAVFREQQGTDSDKENDPMEKQGTVNTEVAEDNVETPPAYNGYQDNNNEESASVWDNLQITGDSLSASPSNEDEDASIDLLSNDDKNSALFSERSSCADNLSDFDDDQDPNFSTDNDNTTYQRVFALKRAYSEENLVSKCAFAEAMLNNGSSLSATIASKSCSHVEHSHAPIMRTKSAEYSASRRWSNPYPLTFSVTPKKKIVLKDSPWETIREDSEIGHHERTPSTNDGRSSRRRKKSKTHRKRSKKVESCSIETKPEATQDKPVLCAYASLNIGDYRRPKSEHDSIHNTGLSGETPTNRVEDTITKSGAAGVVQSEANERDELTTVTKVDVSLKKRSTKLKREKSVVQVDANVSRVPENYLCIETFPTDDRESAGNEAVDGATEGGKIDSFSNVGRLSKYFNERKPETNDKSKSLDMQNASNIKQRVEELKRNSQNVTSSEEKAIVTQELNSIQNIKDRIGDLRRRSTSDETQNDEKVKIDMQSNLTKRVDNVKRLKNRIEENKVVEATNTATAANVTEEQLGNHLWTRLRIKDRIGELLHSPDIEQGVSKESNTLERNVHDEFRGCKRIKDRIEKLQKEKKRELDCERDITISEENERTECLTSPCQNEEHKTVVIKRGWVQQFIQKIETGS